MFLMFNKNIQDSPVAHQKESDIYIYKSQFSSLFHTENYYLSLL